MTGMALSSIPQNLSPGAISSCACKLNLIWKLTKCKYVSVPAAIIPAAWTGDKDYDQAYELGDGVSSYDMDAFDISLTG
jgi:hypothetical protein